MNDSSSVPPQPPPIAWVADLRTGSGVAASEGPDLHPRVVPRASWGLYLGWVRKYWWMMALAGVLGVGGAWLYASSLDPTYEAASVVALTVAEQSLEYPDQVAAVTELDLELVSTVGDLYGSSGFLGEVADDLVAQGVVIDDRSSYEIVATPSLVGYTVGVSLTGPDAEVAAVAARGLNERAAEEFARLYPGYRLEVIEAPGVRGVAVGDSTTLTVMIGLVLGLGVGFLLTVAVATSSMERRSGAWTRR